MSAGEFKPHTHDVCIRGLRYRIHEWGSPEAQPLLLLHGWMDAGITFRLLAHALRSEYRCLAPDWRGFGETDRASAGYWFPDYLADLEALLDRFFPERSVSLVGHSMGGNVACLYAGVRPQRVRHLVSIEGFGLPATSAQEAPQRYARWLDSLRTPSRQRWFGDYAELAAHLQRQQPGLSRERAEALARNWARRTAEGVVLKGDPAHHRPNPVLYRLDEAMACWRCITAPVLWVYGTSSPYMAKLREAGDWVERTACFRDFREVSLPGAGHGLHHEQPLVLAQVIGTFLATH